MIIQTTRFGSITINQQEILRLDKGLLGFENDARFVLVQHGSDNIFAWLQSIDSPELAFVVANPFEFYNNYEFDIETEDVTDLDLASPEDVVVLSILTIPANPQNISANLLAPLLINNLTKKGKQVILKNNKYSTKHYIMQDLQRLAEKKKQITHQGK